MDFFDVSVKKITDVDLLREACESTFIGTSKVSLINMYKAEHSPVRTQLFWVKFNHIPLFIATHLIRHHVGSIPFQLTCRDDRRGANPGLIKKCDALIKNVQSIRDLIDNGDSNNGEAHNIIANTEEELEWIKTNTDRYTPVNLSLLINAQSLIDMAKVRLCKQAHHETIIVFKELKKKMAEVDLPLAKMMVSKCVYRCGLCGELRCCGYNNTKAFKEELKEYLQNFSEIQQGINNNSNTK